MRLLIFLLISSVVARSSTVEISCKDEAGQSVDWFYLYKLPKLEDSVANVPFLDHGSAYAYMTDIKQEWRLSDYSINDTRSLPALTMQVLYNNVSFTELNSLGIGYVLYNDQADSVTLIKGHTKGVLIFNENSAVWIVHSIPHYPPKIDAQRYYINASQLIYGQSMLCLTVAFNTLEHIGQQMLFNYPQVYDYFIPDSLLKGNSLVLDNLLNVIKGNHVTKEPWFNLNILQTLKNNYKFLSFAKFTQFSDDLYTMLVAPHFKSNMATETWNNGAGTLPSNCSLDFHVYNVEQVSFEFLNVTFSVHKDHSKWGVTVPSSGGNSSTVLCLGDINRQVEQFKRSGGTLCLLDNEGIWKQYFKLVKNFDNCEA